MVSSGSVCFVLRGIEEYVIDETGYCRIATSVQFQIEKQQKISRRRSHSSDYPELGQRREFHVLTIQFTFINKCWQPFFFQSLCDSQFTLSINPADKTKLTCNTPHRRSTTVSSETYHFIHFTLLFCGGRQKNVQRFVTHSHCLAQ